METIIEILEILEIQDYEQLILVIFAVIFIWLFKEFRKSYIDNKKENKIDIERALEKYSNLYHTIILFQSNKIKLEQLFMSFDQTIAYLPGIISKEIYELSKSSLDNSSSKLDNLKNILEIEITSLKNNQYSFTSRNSDDTMLNQGSWFFTKYDFDALVNPFVYSVFTFFGVINMYLISTEINKFSGYRQFAFILFIMNFLFMLMSFIYILDSIIKRLISKHAFLVYVLLVIVPFLLTIIISRQLSILNTITIIIFFIISFKKKLLQPHNNKTTTD